MLEAPNAVHSSPSSTRSRWCRRRSVRDPLRPFVQVQLTPEIFGRDCKVYRLGLLEEERGYANQVARTIK